jgi:hypothetical protein
VLLRRRRKGKQTKFEEDKEERVSERGKGVGVKEE